MVKRPFPDRSQKQNELWKDDLLIHGIEVNNFSIQLYFDGFKRKIILFITLIIIISKKFRCRDFYTEE